MSGKHRGGAHDEHMDETWLIPYADLLTLLLALFIVLYASSNIDQIKYNAMAEAFFEEIMNPGGFFQNPPDRQPIDDFPSDEELDQEAMDLERIQKEIQEYLEQKGLESLVSTSIDDRGLVISVNDAVLFDPGKALIKTQYSDVMVQIGQKIKTLNNYIRIEGHTDNIPENSVEFPSNWELSGGRASSVVRLFIDAAGIAPEKLMYVGYGEFRPIAPNDSAENRGKNRRVDIIILSSFFNALEDQRIGT